MPAQPNKPRSGFTDDGTTRPPGEKQAVENQGGTTPEAYPDPARLDASDRDRPPSDHDDVHTDRPDTGERR